MVEPSVRKSKVDSEGPKWHELRTETKDARFTKSNDKGISSKRLIPMTKELESEWVVVFEDSNSSRFKKSGAKGAEPIHKQLLDKSGSPGLAASSEEGEEATRERPKTKRGKSMCPRFLANKLDSKCKKSKTNKVRLERVKLLINTNRSELAKLKAGKNTSGCA